MQQNDRSLADGYQVLFPTFTQTDHGVNKNGEDSPCAPGTANPLAPSLRPHRSALLEWEGRASGSDSVGDSQGFG